MLQDIHRYNAAAPLCEPAKRKKNGQGRYQGRQRFGNGCDDGVGPKIDKGDSGAYKQRQRQVVRKGAKQDACNRDKPAGSAKGRQRDKRGQRANKQSDGMLAKRCSCTEIEGEAAIECPSCCATRTFNHSPADDKQQKHIREKGKRTCWERDLCNSHTKKEERQAQLTGNDLL
jgi:hypothetical protein